LFKPKSMFVSSVDCFLFKITEKSIKVAIFLVISRLTTDLSFSILFFSLVRFSLISSPSTSKLLKGIITVGFLGKFNLFFTKS
jgi:hypothetical protein